MNEMVCFIRTQARSLQPRGHHWGCGGWGVLPHSDRSQLVGGQCINTGTWQCSYQLHAIKRQLIAGWGVMHVFTLSMMLTMRLDLQLADECVLGCQCPLYWVPKVLGLWFADECVLGCQCPLYCTGFPR